jgi:hypothetical protein
MPDFDSEDGGEGTIDVNIDFSQFEATEDSLIPNGNYDAHISKVVVKKKDSEDGKKKYPYLAMEITVDGPDCAGAKLFHNASLSPEGATPFIKVTKFLLLSLGVELASSGPSKLVAGAGGVLTNPNLIGEPVTIIVGKHEFPKGTNRWQNDIQRIKGTHEVPKDGATAVAEARYG